MNSLNESIEAGDVDGVVAWLDNGAGINTIDERTGVTPLIAAVDCQHVALVALLLERGASIDAADEQGQTALHFAVSSIVDARAYYFDTRGETREPDMRILRMLLEAGANAAATDRNGASALNWARDGNLTEVETLLTKSVKCPPSPDGAASHAGPDSRSSSQQNVGTGPKPDREDKDAQ